MLKKNAPTNGSGGQHAKRPSNLEKLLFFCLFLSGLCYNINIKEVKERKEK